MGRECGWDNVPRMSKKGGKWGETETVRGGRKVVGREGEKRRREGRLISKYIIIPLFPSVDD